MSISPGPRDRALRFIREVHERAGVEAAGVNALLIGFAVGQMLAEGWTVVPPPSEGETTEFDAVERREGR